VCTAALSIILSSIPLTLTPDAVSRPPLSASASPPKRPGTASPRAPFNAETGPCLALLLKLRAHRTIVRTHRDGSDAGDGRSQESVRGSLVEKEKKEEEEEEEEEEEGGATNAKLVSSR
jgi:hypothetical protein